MAAKRQARSAEPGRPSAWLVVSCVPNTSIEMPVLIHRTARAALCISKPSWEISLPQGVPRAGRPGVTASLWVQQPWLCHPPPWQELNRTCRAMQQRVLELIPRIANEQLTEELLIINDNLNNVFLRHER